MHSLCAHVTAILALGVVIVLIDGKGLQLNSFFVRCVLLAMTLIAGVTMLVAPSIGATKENSIPHIYHGVALDVSKAKNGDYVSLGTIIFTPTPSQDGYVQLEFPRNIVSNKFIDDLFQKSSMHIRSLHPFWQRGVESILTKNSLIVRLHFGVVLHLRNDMPNFPDYKTFIVENPQAKLVTFGHETYLGTPKASDGRSLKEFFLAWRPNECVSEDPRLPSGPVTYSCLPGEYFPQLYEPRIE